MDEKKKLYRLDEGKMIAIGKHEELIETCEEYRKMVELQKLEEEGGN